MAQDYIHTIGGTFYDTAGFSAEAAALGISRRITSLPADFVLGESRIYCLFGTGHDSAPRKCADCKTLMPSPRRVGGIPETTCPKCGKVHTGKARAVGAIPFYFVPTAMDVVVRVSDADTRTIAQGYVGLGLFDAKLEDTPDNLRMSATIKDGNAEDVLKALATCAGVEIDAKLLAPVVSHTGARIMVVGTEPKRGCGVRKHGGAYLVTPPGSQSPLVAIDPPIAYDGPHFRGLKALTSHEETQCHLHTQGLTVCALPIASPEPDLPTPAPEEVPAPNLDELCHQVLTALIAAGPATATEWHHASGRVAYPKFRAARRSLCENGLVVSNAMKPVTYRSGKTKREAVFEAVAG